MHCVTTLQSLVTTRKRSLGKVMFLHLCAILFTVGVCLKGDDVCLRGGGASASRGVYFQGGQHPGGSASRGQRTTGYRQQAGGTYPTGMHSCFCVCLPVNH